MDPRYKTTVRNADQTVHGRLAKSRLASLLDTVKEIGYGEIERMEQAVGPSGKVVSLHTLMYRLGYNVNCIGIFGSQLDHVTTRVLLQSFTEVSNHNDKRFLRCYNGGHKRKGADVLLVSVNTSCSTPSTGLCRCG